MSDTQIEAYLAAALDQEACKATLTAALASRVAALQTGGITVIRLLACLENLCEDTGQLNTDVIESVMDWMLAGMAGGRS